MKSIENNIKKIISNVVLGKLGKEHVDSIDIAPFLDDSQKESIRVTIYMNRLPSDFSGKSTTLSAEIRTQLWKKDDRFPHLQFRYSK